MVGYVFECFGCFLRGPGGPGGNTNRRGMRKYPGGLISVGFGWNYEGYMPINESLGYAYFFDLKLFSKKTDI